MSVKRKYIYHWLLFILFIVTCSYPLFLNIGKLSVRMWDEARNGINAIEMLQNGKVFVTHFDGQPDMWNSKPPLLIWSIAISMKIFGVTTFALRLPSVLSCLTIIIYFFFFCRKNFQSQWIGILAGLILVTSVGFIDYHVSRNGDFDAMLSMWMFLYATQFYLYIKNRERKNLIYFSLFLAFAILTKGIAGCLILPGLFLYTLISKQNISVYKIKQFYIISILGIFLSISYYLIRENLNSGYIAAVLENEITGRYLETNEGHVGTIWYYYDLLKDQHYNYWIYFLPLSLIFVLVRGEKKLKQASIFFSLQFLTYFVVITQSHTKLPWYDAPLFPFFAIVIAMGLFQLFIEIKKIGSTSNYIIHKLVYILLIIFVFIVPIQSIFATSIRSEKETYYPELFYGDFISSVYNSFPNQHKIIILSEDYNPHLVFYKKVNEMQGRELIILNPRDKLNFGDSILVCEKKMFPVIDSAFVLDTLFEEDNVKYFLKVISPAEYNLHTLDRMLQKKITEIKENLSWNKAIKNKANENKVSYEKQLMKDAVWNLFDLHKINFEQYEALENKYFLK